MSRFFRGPAGGMNLGSFGLGLGSRDGTDQKDGADQGDGTDQGDGAGQGEWAGGGTTLVRGMTLVGRMALVRGWRWSGGMGPVGDGELLRWFRVGLVALIGVGFVGRSWMVFRRFRGLR